MRKTIYLRFRKPDHGSAIDDGDGRGNRALLKDGLLASARGLKVERAGKAVRYDRRFKRDDWFARADGFGDARGQP